MPRSLSPSGIASIQSQETGDVWVAIIELDHPTFAQTIRLVNNDESVMYGGHPYSPFPFELSLPNDVDGELPVLDWAASNVSRELVPEFRAAAASAGYIQARVAWLRANDPTTLEVGWLDLEIRNIPYDTTTLRGTMSVEPLLDQQFGHKKFDPILAPGLF